MRKGLRQVDVAEMAGVSEMTVVNWERYDTMPLRGQAKVKRVCDVLGLDFEEVTARWPWESKEQDGSDLAGPDH